MSGEAVSVDLSGSPFLSGHISQIWIGGSSVVGLILGFGGCLVLSFEFVRWVPVLGFGGWVWCWVIDGGALGVGSSVDGG